MIHPYINKTEVLNSNDAVGFLLAETNNNDIVELHIHKNGLVPSHSLPIDVTFYVISGKGRVTIADEKIDAVQGDIIEINKDLERGWQNLNDESLKLLVIKQKG